MIRENIARVGIIGCGNISEVYFRAGQQLQAFDIVACADVDMQRAEARASSFGVQAMTVEALLERSDITHVINLTNPQAHAPVAMQALSAGKSVYNEKPLTLTFGEAQAMLALTEARHLQTGCAPDTFLGGGLQTCRYMIDQGAIGTPIAGTAFMISHGHESWHPNPTFYYQKGAGPLMDMGPYYITALVALLGPIRRITGASRITFAERTITSAPQAGTRIQVEVPTHVTGVLEFVNGAIVTLVTTFDVWAAQVPKLELYGTSGSLSLPDPNTFGGPVMLWQETHRSWESVPLTHGFSEQSRGIGVAEMVYAQRAGRRPRASGTLAAHVLEAMLAIEEAAQTGQHQLLATTCEQPEALPPGYTEEILL
ncbi:MAG: Gfo/Idh/MocA family oxidoreductase [Ktedonobacteraceae bacterium]